MQSVHQLSKTDQLRRCNRAEIAQLFDVSTNAVLARMSRVLGAGSIGGIFSTDGAEDDALRLLLSATAYASIAQSLLNLPDQLERQHGLDTQIIEDIERSIHTMMDTLADQLQSLGTIER